MPDNPDSVKTTPRTLTEAWQQRRAQLAATDENIQPFKKELIHILDYLLNRYGAAPEGQQPPRSVIPSDLMLNQRAILVHSFLGRRDYACIKNEDEAISRVARVLGRLKNLELHESAQSPAGGAPLGQRGADSVVEHPARGLGYAIVNTIQVLFPTWFAFRFIKRCIRDQNGMLVDEDVEFLGEQINKNHSVPAMQLLLACANPQALECVMAAWQDRVRHRYRDMLSPLLNKFFHLPARKQAAAEAFRAGLAGTETEIRIQAAYMLASLGDLQDVTLLAALLSLPDVTDLRERRVLLHVLHQISGAKPLEPEPVLTTAGATAVNPAPTPAPAKAEPPMPRPILGEMRIWRADGSFSAKDNEGVTGPHNLWVLRRPVFALLTIVALLPIAAALIVWIRLDMTLFFASWWFRGQALFSSPAAWLLLVVMLLMRNLARMSNPAATALFFYPRRLWVALFGLLTMVYAAAAVWLLLSFSGAELPDYFFFQDSDTVAILQFLLPLLPVSALAAYMMTQAVRLAMARYIDAALWGMNERTEKPEVRK